MSKCFVSPVFALSGSQHSLAKNGSNYSVCQTNQSCLLAWFSILMKFSVLKSPFKTQEKVQVQRAPPMGVETKLHLVH